MQTAADIRIILAFDFNENLILQIFHPTYQIANKTLRRPTDISTKLEYGSIKHAPKILLIVIFVQIINRIILIE